MSLSVQKKIEAKLTIQDCLTMQIEGTRIRRFNEYVYRTVRQL